MSSRQERLIEEGLDIEIVQAADDYVDIRDRRMDLTKKEKESKEHLMATMRRKEKTTYSYENKTVYLETEEVETVKVETTGEKPKKGKDKG